MTLKEGCVLGVVLASFGCSASLDRAEPSWTGMYTVRAEGVRKCVEQQTSAGRTCDCDPEGHLEGTLTLGANVQRQPTGELRFRKCLPNDVPSCGPENVRAIRKYDGFPPVSASPDTVEFCAGTCPGANFTDDGMAFTGIEIPSADLSGWFRHYDGNIRACGADSGPFTAIRQ